MEVNPINASVPNFGAKLKYNKETVNLVNSMTLPELISFRKGLNKLDKLEHNDTLEIVRQTVDDVKPKETSFFSKIVNKLFGKENKNEDIKYTLVNRDNQNTTPMDMTNVFNWEKGEPADFLSKKICDALNYAADGSAEKKGLLFVDKGVNNSKDTVPVKYPRADMDLSDYEYESNQRYPYFNNRTLQQVEEEIILKEQIIDMLK